MRRARRRERRQASPQLALLANEDLSGRPVPPQAGPTRRAAPAEAPSPKPWLAALLAVDTAKRSGWALVVRGATVASGELDTLDALAIERVVRTARGLAEHHRLPLVMVLEMPWGGRMQVVAALGEARERWKRAWRDAGQAKGRVLLVRPSTWRGPVLGRSWVSAPRDLVRAQEQGIARALLGRVLGPDEAAAVLIGRWASHAPQVGRAIGKRAAKASMLAWAQEVRS